MTGAIAGAEIAGIQSNDIVSTLKHFALNAQENGRVMLSADLAEGPARESDLLAFELAIERGRPGAVMTGYNRVDGAYASQDAALLDGTLKGDWGFPGWVMSDWSATHFDGRGGRSPVSTRNRASTTIRKSSSARR